MERFLLLDVPSVLFGILFVVIAVGLSLAGLAIVRHSTDLQSLESHNDVAGFIIAVVGALYGVLLAFIVVTVWERFDDASTIADQEADVALALY